MRPDKIQRLVLRSAADPLARRLIKSFYKLFLDPADCLSVAADLNGALLLLKDREAALLFVLVDVIFIAERGRIRTARVLETEQGIVLHFVEQRERLFEILFRFAREANNNIRRDGNIAPRRLQPFNAAHILIPGIQALHALEHARGSGLHWKMDVVAQGRLL